MPRDRASWRLASSSSLLRLWPSSLRAFSFPLLPLLMSHSHVIRSRNRLKKVRSIDSICSIASPQISNAPCRLLVACTLATRRCLFCAFHLPNRLRRCTQIHHQHARVSKLGSNIVMHASILPRTDDSYSNRRNCDLCRLATTKDPCFGIWTLSCEHCIL